MCVCVCAILDTYNQKVVKDIAPTITTLVSASNEIYVVVADEHKKKDMWTTDKKWETQTILCCWTLLHWRGGRDINNLIVSTDGIFPCLTTRPDTLGVVIDEER